MTLAALHGGDPVRARSVIGRAVRTAGDDEGFAAPRHRLLLGWVRMQEGQLAAAAADAAALASTGLHRRDALWVAALQTAIARRGGDSGAVQKHWYAAMEVLTEYSLDLYSLLPLGELWVAAGRLRQIDRLRHTIDQAFNLLDALGNPMLWSLPLHWSGVHAGILANSPEAVAPHGQALTAAAGHSAFAKALATAGRTWLRVLANHVDVDEVTIAARSLAQFGLGWDATRLASQAALHTPDGRVSGAMLQLARDLKLAVVGQDDGVDAPTAVAAVRQPGSGDAAVVAAVRPGTRGRRTSAAGPAVPGHRQPALHLREDRRAPRREDPASAGRRIPVGTAVDVARDPWLRGLTGSPARQPQQRLARRRCRRRRPPRRDCRQAPSGPRHPRRSR